MSEDKTGFEAPNYTQTPNSFFDTYLAQIDHLCELKVTLAVIRKTFGWHKETIGDKISFSQLMELTGLSRQGVSDGIEKALARGTLERWHEGKQTYSYRLKLVYNVDQSTEQTSLQDRPVPVHNVDQLEQKPVYNVDTQKKESKETIKRKLGDKPPSPDKVKVTTPKELDPTMTNPVITTYRDAFKLTPDKEQRQYLIDHIKDLGAWQKVVGNWKLNRYTPKKIAEMVENYTKQTNIRPVSNYKQATGTDDFSRLHPEYPDYAKFDIDYRMW